MDLNALYCVNHLSLFHHLPPKFYLYSSRSAVIQLLINLDLSVVSLRLLVVKSFTLWKTTF